MLDTKELNGYVENFGTVVKKLDEISSINEKIEGVSEQQKETVRELHDQWEKTLPEVDKQIGELKEMVAATEKISQSQADLLGGLDEKLRSIEERVGKNTEITEEKIAGVSDQIGKVFDDVDRKLSDADQHIDKAADEIKNKIKDLEQRIENTEKSLDNIASEQKSGKTLQIVTLVAALAAAAAAIVSVVI